MRTIAITGSASGIGAATAKRLEGEGQRVIGVDLRDAEIVADLSTPDGRRAAIDGILELSGGKLDGLVPCAGLMGLPDRPASLLVRVNYFGSIELFEGLREALAASGEAAAVGLCSNSTTTSPGLSMDIVEACVAGDEDAACTAAERAGSIQTYAPTKLALGHWIRSRATTEDWIGRGITLNAVAPGKTQTPMVAEGKAHPVMGPLLDAFPIPAGRDGRPEEIANLICYLLGPEARFFVGSVIFCDGGTDALLRPQDWPAPMPAPER